MKLLFIETTLFTRLMPTYWSDQEYREFQDFLAKKPDAGDLIQGTGGLRKVRWSGSGKGKRGGVRVIYYWWDSRQRIFLMTLYAKNEVSDLTKDQRQALTKLVEAWKDEQA